MVRLSYRWQRKAAADALKSLLPFQDTFRRIKRGIKPYATNPLNDEHLLGDAVRQIAALRRLGVSLKDRTAVELGTGWKPILSFAYRIFGASNVITVDLERLLDLRQFLEAYQYIKQNLDRTLTKVREELQPPDLAQIKTDLPTLQGSLKASRIDYLAPYNFLSLPEKSADLIFSRTVLEHIPEKQLNNIFAHSFHVLKPGGIMCHTIDMSDHWEHADKRISKVNFLQYDGWAWSLTGMNPQNYQNRLRRYEYVAMIKRSGFEILLASGSPHPATLAALEGLHLIDRYRDVSFEELAVVDTTIVAYKP